MRREAVEMTPLQSGWHRQQLPAWAIQVARLAREVALRLIDPLDRLVRAANGKRDLPPIHLRRYVGPLRSFESSGAEFVAYLKLVARLAPHESLLDIGCGCGLIALGLQDYLSTSGAYVGLDIHKPSIRWCQRAIQNGRPQFRFDWIDVRNATFHPRGAARAENYVLPVSDAAVDVVLLKSVFTHMRPAEVENYLRETARALKPGGRCLLTAFLFEADPTIEARYGRTPLTFRFGDATWRYEYAASPDTAIAYSQSFMVRVLSQQGFMIQNVLPGLWRDQQRGLSYQDLLLVEKPRKD